MLPHRAASVETRVGSGVTVSLVMPSRSRWAVPGGRHRPKALVGMGGELRMIGAASVCLPHISERRLVDHIVGVAGAQQLEEVQGGLFGTGSGETGEVVVAAFRADGVAALVPGAGVVNRDEGGRLQAGAQHHRGPVEESSWRQSAIRTS